MKHRFYVPPSQLASSPPTPSILYPSNYYLISLGCIKNEIIHGDIKICQVSDWC